MHPLPRFPAPPVILSAGPIAAVILLLAGWALSGCTRQGANQEHGADGGAIPADSRDRGRVVIVGIDGADWRVIRPLVEQGRLPSFHRLLTEGATGVLESMEPSASPSLWTTVATGVTPERHNIHGFVVPADGGSAASPTGTHGDLDGGRHAGDRPSGPRQNVRPVTSTMRMAPAFWTILPGYGLRVGVVGWLVTWPAEPVDGFMVSSYLPYIYNWSTGRPLKGTIVEGIPHATYPEGLMDEIEPLKVKPSDLDPELVARFYDPSRLDDLTTENRECVEGFLWSLAFDETYRRIGLALLDRSPVDLFAVYFGGVDVVSHRFWKFANPGAKRYGVRADEAAILGGVIDSYYEHVDTMLGEYLDRLTEDDTLVVLSDHGFMPVMVPGRPTMSGHHRMLGILAIWGRGAKAGHRIIGARLVDILPTVLTFLDVPIARDLEGQVLTDALDPVFAVAHRPRFVEGYEVDEAPPLPEASELDQNMLERLRSLGYIN